MNSKAKRGMVVFVEDVPELILRKSKEREGVRTRKMANVNRPESSQVRTAALQTSQRTLAKGD